MRAPASGLRPPAWAIDLLVLLVAALVLGIGLDLGPIRDNNEALYADIGWAMAHGAGWVIPHLDGVAYIEKPPLLYWLMAASFKLFGFGAWQSRLPDALSAWLICAGMIGFGRAVDARFAGRFAALVCGSALGFVLIARTILFDPLLLLLWLAALATLLLGLQRRQRGWLRASAVLLALATLTKGPVALLTLGLVLALQIALQPRPWTRRQLLRLVLDPWAIALYLAVCAPWMVLASLQQRDFAWFFFVNETWGRFVGTRIPDDFHHGPWWFYGPKLLIGFFQWSPLLLLAGLRAPALHGDSAAALSGRWARNAAVVLLLFYSAASDKGNYYLLPAVPLLAWWLGVRTQRWLGDARRACVWLAAGVLLAGIAALLLGAVASQPEVRARMLASGMPPTLLATLPGLLLQVELPMITAAALLLLHRPQAGLAVFALTALPLVGFAVRLDQVKVDDLSQQRVAAAVLHRSGPATSMYSWQDFEDQDASLLTYGLRPLRVIDSHSADLWFGCHHAGANSPCVTPQQFLQARTQAQPVAVWVARSKLAGFEASGLGRGMQRLDFRACVVFVTPGAADQAKK